MKKALFGLLMALCFAVISLPAFAATITLLNTTGAEVRNDIYTGFYTIYMDGREVPAMCIDFNQHISLGLSAEVDINNYYDIQAGAGKFAGLTNAPTRYNQVGWLFSQASTDVSHNADLQEAAWKIMGGSPTMSDNGNDWFESATDGTHDEYNWLNIAYVLTPSPFNSFQEMLTPVPVIVNPPSAVPIPAAAQLFSLGLVGLIGAARGKK